MTAHPTGTVTFLFTDIENSSRLAREHPDTWEGTQARHHAILREAIKRNNGFIFQVIGDAFCAAFHKAGEALKAAISAQQELQNEPWGEFTIYVRMGIHTGEAELEGNEYRGYSTLSFVQRLMSAGQGGQILVSNTTENLLREQLPQGISLREMGMQKFAGVPSPVHIFQVLAPDLPRDFPPLRTVENLPNNLPIQLTSFVGREKELGDVRRLLQNTRLLTLIGPGGTGKTRLSIQAAADSLTAYPDGVWFVEFAPILDPHLVPRTTAITIGLRDEPQRPIIDMLCDYLSEKKILLILDNCEHLVDACARMTDKILQVAVNVRILASSREALGIGGEATYRVPSLEVPDPSQLPPIESLNQYEAVKLFIDRAMSAVPTFTVTNENAPALAQVCYHLDGIPLAIELAAAKIRVLSVEQIAGRLDDRFRLLTGGSRTALERQQTLRAAIDWSYNLLPSREQILFQRLSVFVGGWTLEAAESICSDGEINSEDVLELLEQLIHKSLLIKEEEQGESNYHMLETLRQYANEKLMAAGENGTLRDRHLEYFLNLAETAEPHLLRPEQIKWLSVLGANYENLRFAFEWALSKEAAEPSLKLSAALGWFWDIREYTLEGSSWIKRALAKASQNENRNEKISRARALAGYAMLQWELDDYEQMLSSAQESLALALEVSTKKDIAIARDYVGAALALLGEDQQARTLLEQSFADFQELNDPFWQAFCFQLLAYLLMKQGALTYHNRFSRVLEFARKAGERWLMANALNRYAKRLMRLNRFDEAKEYIEEADRLCKQLGLENSSDVSLSLAQIAWCNGDTQEVTSRLTELQERFKVLGYKSLRARCLSDLGWLAMEEGNLQEAQLFLEQGLALMRETGFKPDIVPCLIRLSHLSYLQRNLEAFKQYFRESFSLRSYLSNYDKTYMLMTVLGSLYFQNSETSALLMGVAASFEKEDDLPLIVIEKPYWNRAESHARKSLGDAAFESAFAQGQKMSLDDGLDFAMKTVEEITESKLPPDTAIEDSIIPAIFPSQREVEKQKYGGLTTREREVAAQIAQGKSNQTIAAELFVGLKTVETHVTHILAKLGFTSRAQIAGWAVAKGLAEGPQDVNSPSREG